MPSSKATKRSSAPPDKKGAAQDEATLATQASERGSLQPASLQDEALAGERTSDVAASAMPGENDTTPEQSTAPAASTRRSSRAPKKVAAKKATTRASRAPKQTTTPQAAHLEGGGAQQATAAAESEPAPRAARTSKKRAAKADALTADSLAMPEHARTTHSDRARPGDGARASIDTLGADASRIEAHVPAIPVLGPPLPYQPSVPCASCARGTDPLRAACISMTERSVHYFCSRSCRESYVRSEQQHHQKLEQLARAPEPHPVAAPRDVVRPAVLEPVARRVAPAPASTPRWPLLSAAAFAALGVASPGLPIAGADQLAALCISGVAAALSSRAALTRERGSLVGWLAAPIGVAALALSSVFAKDQRGVFGVGQAPLLLLGAATGVLVIWLREHWLERERAISSARRTELFARLSPRVRVSSAPPPATQHSHAARSEPVAVFERTLEQLRIGDELLVEAGTVIAADGVVLTGLGEVLPYPGARVPVERSHGQLVLAGALVTRGSLRVRATAVGDRCSLFQVFREQPPSDASESRAERLAQAAGQLEHALKLLVPMAIAASVLPHGLAHKLAALGAGLVALPAVAFARGLRSAQRRAVIAGAARGVSYREPLSVERAGALDTVVLRVEGPLVSRRYTLIEICSLSDTHDATALLELALAAGAAQESHGIARAVREYATPRGIEAAALRRLVLARGRGVTGLTDGQGALVFGSRAALLSAGVSVAVADREAQSAELLGQRVVFLALGGRARGLFVFAQTVQPEARIALQTMFDLGLEVELVSGDHRPTVEAIARTLDITQVKAELSSEQRAAEVRRLRDGEAKVVAIGHVPEDQSLLAAADLSVSLDASLPPGEHDVSYDITTASPDLRDAAAALSLARRARRDIQQTMFACALGTGLGVLAALGVISPLLAIAAAPLVDWVCLSRPQTRHAEANGPRASRPQGLKPTR